MAEVPKPGAGAAAHIPQSPPNQEAATPAGQRVEERARYFPRPVYEPQRRSLLRSFRDAYGVYGRWLIVFGLLAFALGRLAYGLDHEHFWFHVCVELAIASFM